MRMQINQTKGKADGVSLQRFERVGVVIESAKDYERMNAYKSDRCNWNKGISTRGTCWLIQRVTRKKTLRIFETLVSQMYAF